jgi:hypothetical protein
MPAREVWIVVETSGRLWLHERVGETASDRIVTRVELATGYPRLYAELIAANNRDAPFVVMERAR